MRRLHLPAAARATPAAQRRITQARIQNCDCHSPKDLLTRTRPLLALRIRPIVMELSADFGSASDSIIPILRKVAECCHSNGPAAPSAATSGSATLDLFEACMDYLIMFAMRMSNRESQNSKDILSQFLQQLGEFEHRLQNQQARKVALLLESNLRFDDQADLEWLLWLRLLLFIILLMLLCSTLGYGSFLLHSSTEAGGRRNLRIFIT
jgi:hypothetical protein